MANKPNTHPIRADWFQLIMKYLFDHVNDGHIPLNEFATSILKIKPDDIEGGIEFDRTLQGLEDRNLIFYKVKAKTEKGTNNTTLNTVDFFAILQQDGLRLMIESRNSKQITNLTYASILIAGFAVITSIASVIIQASDNTDKELLKLNQQLQKPMQSLEKIQQSQEGIDETLRQIKDSL